MQQMEIAAIYTKPKLSQATAGHTIYPYLLRGVKVARVNQVWSTDITSIRLHQGFVYLVAVIDWFSRYVLRWALSVTLDGQFCREALLHTLRDGARPEIFNTDQGVQFTSRDFTGLLQDEGIQVSMVQPHSNVDLQLLENKALSRDIIRKSACILAAITIRKSGHVPRDTGRHENAIFKGVSLLR